MSEGSHEKPNKSGDKNTIMTLLVVMTLLVIGWQGKKLAYEHYNKQQRLIIAQKQLQQYAQQIGTLATAQEQNRIAHDFYHSLGHTIAALHIQLQVAHKLWQVDPTQAQRSLLEACELSTTLLKEVRQTVRTINPGSIKEPL